MFDAGISGRQAHERLVRRGLDVADVDALLISHDHVDHSRSMGVYQRKFGLPVYVTAKTLRAVATRHPIGELSDACHFQAGATLKFGTVAVETIPTPHDGADGVAFVVDDGRSRLGILTDLGHVFAGLDAVIRSLDAVLLESNYDPKMLARGSYPAMLKHRIRGPGGHLSNLEAAELLGNAGTRRLRWACLGHLSEENNNPALALATHRRVLGDALPLCVATRYEATEVMHL